MVREHWAGHDSDTKTPSSKISRLAASTPTAGKRQLKTGADGAVHVHVKRASKHSGPTEWDIWRRGGQRGRLAQVPAPALALPVASAAESVGPVLDSFPMKRLLTNYDYANGRRWIPMHQHRCGTSSSGYWPVIHMLDLKGQYRHDQDRLLIGHRISVLDLNELSDWK